MKKIRLSLMLVALVFATCLMSGCVKSNDDTVDNNQKDEEKSIASVLANQFKEEIQKTTDIESIANKIAKNEIIKIELDVATLEEQDYISGFKTEIKDFKKAIAIQPFIGTIPFIAYIFEVENAEEFAENLKSNADLRWNICTEADDLETAFVDNYVFIVMSPKNFDEE